MARRSCAIWISYSCIAYSLRLDRTNAPSFSLLQVLASRSGKSLGCWYAQSTSVSQIAKGGNYVITLSADGGILGWHVASLSTLDALIQEELSKRSDKFTQKRHLRYS